MARLDDFVVLLRHALESEDVRFGCAITPSDNGLARLRAFVDQSAKSPLRPGQRKAWIEQLRAELGRQVVEVYGLDPRTRAARAIVDADYHMKLVGMGLAEGVPGVRSYLDLVKVRQGEAPPPMDVLRWWFVMDYEPVVISRDGLAMALRGRGVRVLSENERLTAEGKRIHTGQSDIWNSQFAESFTEHFDSLARRYPVYAGLRNVFDAALVAALIRQERLAAKAAWTPGCFSRGGSFQVELAEPITEVDSVVNHRLIDRVHVVAGVSGGVRVDPAAIVSRGSMRIEPVSLRTAAATAAPCPVVPDEAWWWD